MAVIDFSKVEKVLPGDVMGIAGAIGTPAGPTNHAERPTLYDPVWGYIAKLGQVYGFQYAETKTYGNLATFSILGSFTRNAEVNTSGTDMTDDQAFTALTGRFSALEQIFHDAAAATAPLDFADWGGPADPRCIPLPAPFLDKNGGTIYVLATNFSVAPGLWANGINYRATVTEAKFSTQKMYVNNVLLDKGLINITLPAPILFRKRIVGCVGELIQVLNYSCLEVEVSGRIPRGQASGDVISDTTRQLVDSIALDLVSVGLVDQVNGPVLYFTNMDPDAGGSVDATVEAYEDVITLRMKSKI